MTSNENSQTPNVHEKTASWGDGELHPFRIRGNAMTYVDWTLDCDSNSLEP